MAPHDNLQDPTLEPLWNTYYLLRAVAQVRLRQLGPGRTLDELLPLGAELTHLRARHPRVADVVLLDRFGGLSRGEIAEVLGVDEETVDGDRRFADALARTRERRARRNGSSPFAFGS